MQIPFAIWAVVETRADLGSTLRAIERQRFAHHEVDDESEREICGHQCNYEKRPGAGTHAAALRVAIDVADQEENDCDRNCDGRYNARERKREQVLVLRDVAWA